MVGPQFFFELESRILQRSVQRRVTISWLIRPVGMTPKKSRAKACLEPVGQIGAPGRFSLNKTER